MTDGVWWFFLFWAPAYFSDQYGYTSDSGMGIALIFTLYAICTILSIGGGYLPKIFVEKYGMNPYAGRMRAMLIFACFPVLGLFAQPLGTYSAWWPAILIGLLGAGHQSWSANIFSTVGNIFGNDERIIYGCHMRQQTAHCGLFVAFIGRLSYMVCKSYL